MSTTDACFDYIKINHALPIAYGLYSALRSMREAAWNQHQIKEWTELSNLCAETAGLIGTLGGEIK